MARGCARHRVAPAHRPRNRGQDRRRVARVEPLAAAPCSRRPAARGGGKARKGPRRGVVWARLKFKRRGRRLFEPNPPRTVVITIPPAGGKPVSIKRKITFRKRR